MQDGESALEALDSRRFSLKALGARNDSWKREESRVVGFHRYGDIGVDVGEGDGNYWNSRLRLIAN